MDQVLNTIEKINGLIVKVWTIRFLMELNNKYSVLHMYDQKVGVDNTVKLPNEQSNGLIQAEWLILAVHANSYFYQPCDIILY